MSNYPLDKKMLEEEYGDLLIKAALREYAIEQSERLEREAAGEEPLPPADDRVIRGAFRRAAWQDGCEVLLAGAKKAVTRVAVVFLAAALTITTAFALSPAEKKQTVLQKVLETIRYYTDKLTTAGSTLVEYPRYRFEDFEYIEVPNEQVQEVVDTWVIFRYALNFSGNTSLTINQLLWSMYLYCEAKGLEYPYIDESGTWVDGDAVREFAENLFGITGEQMAGRAQKNPQCYDAGRNAYRDSRHPGYPAIARAGITGYTENEDGSFTIDLVMDPEGEPNGYCYCPMRITADYSSGHLVLRSGLIFDPAEDAARTVTP